MAEDNFDYVIVGAGSAGCVLADRLTEDGRNSVLVLEKRRVRPLHIHPDADGAVDSDEHAEIRLALSHGTGARPEPEPGLGGRKLHTPRGKVLGGSSSINGLVYVRGNPLDFDRWEEEGAHGWGYRNVLPYFRRAEKWSGGADAYRGDAGKLCTSLAAMRNPLNPAWIEAGRQAGYPITADPNGFQQEGFGRMHMTVGDGRRCSAANAYLRPAHAPEQPGCPHPCVGQPGFVRGTAGGGCELQTRRRDDHRACAARSDCQWPGPSTRRNC